jgi:hypothetical protein
MTPERLLSTISLLAHRAKEQRYGHVAESLRDLLLYAGMIAPRGRFAPSANVVVEAKKFWRRLLGASELTTQQDLYRSALVYYAVFASLVRSQPEELQMMAEDHAKALVKHCTQYLGRIEIASSATPSAQEGSRSPTEHGAARLRVVGGTDP